VSLALVWCVAILASVIHPDASRNRMLEWGARALYSVLPSTDLLSETRFLEMTSASLHRTSWTTHAVALAYGLDYALVFLLLALWSFRGKGLTRE
jgi:hypothetical protein